MFRKNRRKQVMRRKKKKHRRTIAGMICILLAVSLTGCQSKVNFPKQGNTDQKDSKKEKGDENSDSREESGKNGTDKKISSEESLTALRQSMEGTSQQFAAAYLGYIQADYVDRVQEWIEMKYPDLLSEMTFIKEISKDRICGHGPAELFCIVPRSGDDPVSVDLMELNYDTGISEIKENLYKSETGEPFLVMCNGDAEGIGQVQVSMGTEAGYQADWVPVMDMDGRIWIPKTESNVEQAKDFTDYKACDVVRFTDWYGDVSDNIQKSDLTETCWEIQVDEPGTDTYGDYFLELLENGYARISWSEKEYGQSEDSYGDIICEIYEGNWEWIQQDGKTYLTVDCTRIGGEWCQEGESPVSWKETYRIYSAGENMLLLEKEDGFASMPSKTGSYRVLNGSKTYG